MTEFVLRILFTGLMAFVPNDSGTEVTVLLLEADHYHTSDGAAMQPHKPVIFVRGNCSGDCVTNDQSIASFMFRDQSAAVALDSLAYALGNGSAAWISGSDLEVRKSGSGAANLPALQIRNDVRRTIDGQPQIIPTTSTERRDISWIPQMQKLCTSGCTFDPDLLASVPPGIVAARFKINSGELYTHSLARIGSDVTPVHFKRLDGTGSISPYVQAITSWVGLEIAVTGESVQLVETKYDGSAGRSMTLSPDESGKVEMAVLNLPPFVPPASPNNEAPEVGKHFELYYELLQSPPDRATRLVPRAGAPAGTTVPQVSWTSVHPAGSVDSVLLNRLRLEPGRSLYDRAICPPFEP